MKNNTISIGKNEIELIRKLNEESVYYLVIGGLAVQYYVPLRTHNDIDIWLLNTEENSNKFISVITNMIGIIPKLTTSALTAKDVRLPLKNLGYNIDVLNSLNSIGAPFNTAYEEKEMLIHKNTFIPVLSKIHPISSKKNTNNVQDKHDISLLQNNA